MTNYATTFSKKRAEEFAAYLAAEGIKAEITSLLDAFGQKQYRVEWEVNE